MGDTQQQSFLLYGPPGCAKSLFAHAMLNEAEPQSQILFESSKVLQNPDSLISSLEDVQRFEMFGMVIEQIEEFLNAMRQYPGPYQYLLDHLRSPKCVKVIVGTARRPEALRVEELDAFAHVWPFLYPDEEARLGMLELYTRNV